MNEKYQVQGNDRITRLLAETEILLDAGRISQRHIDEFIALAYQYESLARELNAMMEQSRDVGERLKIYMAAVQITHDELGREINAKLAEARRLALLRLAQQPEGKLDA